MEFRKATIEDDTTRLAEVINKAYRGKGGWTTEADLVLGDRMPLDELKRVLQDETRQRDQPIFLALKDQHIVGCVQAENVSTHTDRAVLGKPLFYYRGGDTLIEYQGLFAVDPTAQGGGVGRKLVQHAMQHMKNEWKCSECEIWVLDSRTELLEWYERMGFRRVEGPGGKKPFVWPEKLKENAETIEFQILRVSI